MIGIYMFHNNINDKVYIGQSVNIEKRKKDHLNSAKNTFNKNYNDKLHKAFRKYGFENFDFVVLEECKKEELNSKEISYIAKYDSTNTKKGYNISKGGDSHSEIGKEVYQIDINTKKILNKYTSVRDCERQNNFDSSSIAKACRGEKKQAYGYIWSYVDEYSENKYKGKKIGIGVKRPVYQIDIITGEIIKRYDSSSEASRVVFGNARESTRITHVCKGKNRTAGDFAWCYIEDYDKDKYVNYRVRYLNEQKEILRKLRTGTKLSEETKKKIGDSERGVKQSKESIEKRRIKAMKKVVCIEKNKVFNSIKEAGEFANINPSLISMVCNNSRHTAGGFHWKFYESEEQLNVA